jgi:glutathione S-transferase
MDDAPGLRSLLTFAPMIDSEVGRWVLVHHGVPYRETPHIFGWASVLSLFQTGTTNIPLLHGNGPSVASARAIVDYYDQNCPVEKRLVPAEADLAAAVNADWSRFNIVFGGAVAVVCYYHLLPHRAIMIEPFTRGVPELEAISLDTNYAAYAGLINNLLQLSASGAQHALTRLQSIVAETDQRIADGRQYLVGDRFTLSDMALATSAGPVLLPEHYGSPIPPFEVMPSELQAIISELREHETARFVERIYRQHRQSAT